MNHIQSIGSMLNHWATERPDQIGIEVVGREALTFGDWRREATALAHRLVASGARPADRIGFIGKNSARWAVVMAAASLVRAAAIPFNWRLSRREMGVILSDAAPTAMVVEAEFLPLAGLERPGDDDLYVVIDGVARGYSDWLAGSPDSPIAPDPSPDDIALMIYTSGTSGRPKGVELANRAIAMNLTTTAPWDIRAGDTVMVPAPNFHVSGTGWVFYCLGLGATSLYLLDIEPADILELFASGRVDHALTVPAVVQMLVQHPDARRNSYPKLRTLIYGGSPMSPTIASAAEELFDCDLVQSYGMTETCGPITFLSPDDHRRGGELLTSAGRPVPELEVGIFDPATGLPCPPHQLGEVWTRSDMLLSGYRNQPDELDAVLRHDGWFRTGDGGYVDEDGYLYLRDRIKDMIISGGENIYPVEVENVLMSHPAVSDVAVIGVPSEKWGETVRAIVVRSKDVGGEELIEFCRERLAHYKCPTAVEFAEELPRNPSGKILKRRLRGMYADSAATP